jgi:aspartate dehydrogenase
MMDVALLGWGAIGRAVGAALADGDVAGARLVAVADRRGAADCPAPLVDPERLGDGADVVVEAAGQEALTAHGERYLRSGCRLLVVSVGALVDRDLFERLQGAGADRLYLTTGAIGGLDLLRAARRAGPIDELTLTTTKRPSSLVQDWMDDDLLARLRAASGTGRPPPADGASPSAEIVVFDGPAAEAVRRFPQSVNVAATLALTSGSWDLVRVRVVADPTIGHNRHEIAIAGAAGRYRFTIENHPSPDNPKTSGIVPHAVLQGLAALAGGGWRLAVG